MHTGKDFSSCWYPLANWGAKQHPKCLSARWRSLMCHQRWCFIPAYTGVVSQKAPGWFPCPESSLCSTKVAHACTYSSLPSLAECLLCEMHSPALEVYPALLLTTAEQSQPSVGGLLLVKSHSTQFPFPFQEKYRDKWILEPCICIINFICAY